MAASWLYLLHFDRPLVGGKKSSRHYLGAARDLDARIAQHRAGTSRAKIMRALYGAGISFEVARVWQFKGPRTAFHAEAEIKRQHNHRRFCPMCNPHV